MARRWTSAEDHVLARLYADGIPLAAIAAQLGRSPDALVARRHALGVAPRRGRTWSPRIDALLVASARDGVPASVLAQRLGLPADAVRRRRRQLVAPAPAARRYRPEEDAALRAALATGHRVEELAGALGRSGQALRLRARVLGLTAVERRVRWTAEEDRLVRAGYAAGLRCAAIAAELPHPRSAEAVAARARKLGLATYARLWTAADDGSLRRLVAAGVALEDAAEALARTPEALRRRARKLDLPAPRRRARERDGQRWAAAEDALLRRNPGAQPARLARALGRSDQAISRRLAELGLRRGRERSPHHPVTHPTALAPGEVRLLERELAHGGTRRLLALARRLNRPLGALRPPTVNGGSPKPSERTDEHARSRGS